MEPKLKHVPVHVFDCSDNQIIHVDRTHSPIHVQHMLARGGFDMAKLYIIFLT
jgi:hypothetical protein